MAGKLQIYADWGHRGALLRSSAIALAKEDARPTGAANVETVSISGGAAAQVSHPQFRSAALTALDAFGSHNQGSPAHPGL
jgi:hypothetical protein